MEDVETSKCMAIRGALSAEKRQELRVWRLARARCSRAVGTWLRNLAPYPVPTSPAYGWEPSIFFNFSIQLEEKACNEGRKKKKAWLPNLANWKMFMCRINSKLLLFSFSCLWERQSIATRLSLFPGVWSAIGQARPDCQAGSHRDHQSQPGAWHQLWASVSPASSSSHQIGGKSESRIFPRQQTWQDD